MASIIRPEPGKGKKPKTDEAKSRGGKKLPPVRGKKLPPVEATPVKQGKNAQKLKLMGLKSVKARTINTMNKTKPTQPKRPGGR
jgi:hypothetical protein